MSGIQNFVIKNIEDAGLSAILTLSFFLNLVFHSFSHSYFLTGATAFLCCTIYAVFDKRIFYIILITFNVALATVYQLIIFLVIAGVLAALETIKVIKSSDCYLMALAALAHLADGFTTYIGLRKGLSEQNIFLELLAGSNLFYVIIVKLFVVAILIWSYHLLETNRALLYKLIFFLGSILFFNNLILILAL